MRRPASPTAPLVVLGLVFLAQRLAGLVGVGAATVAPVGTRLTARSNVALVAHATGRLGLLGVGRR